MTESESFSSSAAYSAFRRSVPVRRVLLDGHEWKFYDYGPKDFAAPLICLHGVAGTAESFYKQIVSLSSQGIRVISAQYGAVTTSRGWCEAFAAFLEDMNLGKAHLFGEGLGGYLAQSFAIYMPSRVASLILCNSFVSTAYFKQKSSIVPPFEWLPEFILKKIVLSQLPEGALENDIMRSVDFVVEQLEGVPRAQIATRLALSCEVAEPLQAPLEAGAVMILEVCDDTAVPASVTEQVGAAYPNARVATLKTGGNFPFLSRADEVNMHILVHFRANAVVPSALETNEPEPTAMLTKTPTVATAVATWAPTYAPAYEPHDGDDAANPFAL